MLWCTVVGTVFAGILATPQALDYFGKVVAPWTTLPTIVMQDHQETLTQLDGLHQQQLVMERQLSELLGRPEVVVAIPSTTRTNLAVVGRSDSHRN